MAGAQMGVRVNIGAKLSPSFTSTVSAAERRMSQWGRRMRIVSAETRIAAREITAAMKPLAALAASGGLTIGFKNTITAGANFMHEVAAMRVAGRTADEVMKAVGQAKRTAMEVPTSTLTENLKLLRETTGAYGDMKHAIENLSFNQRLGYMMSSMAGMDPATAQHSLVAGIQALEIRGSAMDHTRYQREMNELFRATAFFAGKEGAFTPESLRAFAKTGNIPLKLMSERFMTKILPAMITEVGSGDIIGTQASAFNNWLNGNTGTGNKSKTEFAKKIGLVSATDSSQLTKTGWKPGAVLGTDLAKSDPFQWIETILLPKLEKAGYNTKDTKSLELAVSSLFGRETAKRYVMGMADPLQRKRLHKDEENVKLGMTSEAGYAFMLKHDPQAAWAKVMAKIDNLATVLGEKVFTDKTIGAIDKFATGIEKLSGFFDRNPILAQGAVGTMGAGALAGIATLFGGGGLVRMLFSAMASPFKMVWGLLFSSIGKMGPRIPWATIIGGWMRSLGGFLMRGLRPLGSMLWAGLRAAGPMLLRGLISFGPLIIRGIATAFALLSNPVGWAVILAGCAAALIYYFRDDIAKWWKSTFLPAWKGFWQGAKNDVLAMDWGSLGTRIGDALTGGLITKLKSGNIGAALKAALNPGGLLAFTPLGIAGRAVQAGVNLAGKRALGGPVIGGRTYLVGERGPELFTAPNSGKIIPANDTARIVRGGRGQTATVRSGSGNVINVSVGGITIQGASDPAATAREVERVLRRLANGQAVAFAD